MARGFRLSRLHARPGARAHRAAQAHDRPTAPPHHPHPARAAGLVPAARFAPGWCPCDRVHPRMEGWAERRQAHYFVCRVSETRRVRTQRGAARPMTRDARLSALHRGGFRPGAALPSPALPPDPCSELLAARSSCLAGGVPDLPSPRLRAAAAGRHSPLRLRDRLRRRPSMSGDTNHIYYKPDT